MYKAVIFKVFSQLLYSDQLDMHANQIYSRSY
jgi:hypothetical protein